MPRASVVSALTLAALEDSGWYRVEYSQAQPLLHGRRQGCAFLEEPCVRPGRAPLDRGKT